MKTLAEILSTPCEYKGDWSNINDLKETFKLTSDELFNCVVLHAYCDEGGWEGEAHVRYYNMNDEKFYEVNAYHCSCYDFDGMFDPEEIGDLEMYIKYCEHKNLQY